MIATVAGLLTFACIPIVAVAIVTIVGELNRIAKRKRASTPSEVFGLVYLLVSLIGLWLMVAGIWVTS